MKQPRWITGAYKGTDIHWSKSQTEIYKKLNELGIYDIRFTNLRDRFALEFLVTLPERDKPRAVRIIVPLRVQVDDEKRRERELNRIHRVLLNHLKSKFVAITSGLSEFEEEFMSHLVITDKHGNSRTLGESLLPEYHKAIDSGENPDFKLLGNGS
jgi:hypothetical protein